jgi:hypothetical protein
VVRTLVGEEVSFFLEGNTKKLQMVRTRPIHVSTSLFTTFTFELRPQGAGNKAIDGGAERVREDGTEERQRRR